MTLKSRTKRDDVQGERCVRCVAVIAESAVSASGKYRGKYQFSQATWEALGGTGDPAEAEESVQDQFATTLYNERGLAPWPSCGAQITASED